MSRTFIARLVPDPETLLKLSPQEIGQLLLGLAQAENGMFQPGGRSWVFGDDYHRASRDYPAYDQRYAAVDAVLREGVDWLRHAGLIMPAADDNGRHGWMVLTRAGVKASVGADEFGAYVAAAQVPKHLLHASIAEKAALFLARGDLAEAVFMSARTLEEAVRFVGDYDANSIGTDLMRMAFHPEHGRLTDPAEQDGERQALGDLFAGAIGSYKNPHSHRSKPLTVREAQQMVAHVSYLLDIVDARRELAGERRRAGVGNEMIEKRRRKA